MKHFAEHDMETYSPPIVAVGPHSGNPHYETGTGEGTHIREGDFVLIDLWAKFKRPAGRLQRSDPRGLRRQKRSRRSYTEIFQIVAKARDAAIETVRSAFAAGRPMQGWEVDRAARDVISAAGYGEHFVHRTGHSIGQEVHGNGANMDDLETHETRRILRRTCFSIEPGIYLPEFGVRLEVDVYIDSGGRSPRHGRCRCKRRRPDSSRVLSRSSRLLTSHAGPSPAIAGGTPRPGCRRVVAASDWRGPSAPGAIAR